MGTRQDPVLFSLDRYTEIESQVYDGEAVFAAMLMNSRRRYFERGQQTAS